MALAGHGKQALLRDFSIQSLSEDQNFMAGKLQAAQYFIRWEFPELEHQAQLLNELDDTCLNMQESWF